MSWREQLQDASFRGVPFFVEERDLSGGRRKVVHEYPGRDKPYVEDMGRKAKPFSYQCYVLGDDYLAAAQALENALDRFGPGELVDPWIGRTRVDALEYRRKDHTKKGGYAEFSIEFIEAGDNKQPAAVVNSGAAVSSAVDALNEQATAVFVDSFSVAGQPRWSVDQINDALGSLAQQIRGNTARLLSQIGQPNLLAASLITAAGSVVREGELALLAFERAINIGKGLPTISIGSSIDAGRARNQWAMVSLARQAALGQAAAAASTTDLISRDDATQLLQVADAAIEQLQSDVDPFGQPVDSSIYYAMSDIRAALVRHVQQTGLQLPRLRQFTPATTEPALVIAHRLYGDALRDGEIIQRNRIRDPGFVRGGESLEVLADV